MVSINNDIRDIASPLLTVGEASKLLHIHANTIRRWADSGLIESYRISCRGDRRFKKSDILKFLTEMNQNNGYLISNYHDTAASPANNEENTQY
jgi:excisionase family DNA binding protein